MDDERREHSRRVEDYEMARWRGSMEARVQALESSVTALLTAVQRGEVSMTEVKGSLIAVREDIGELRHDIEKAAADIERGKNEAVAEFRKKVENKRLSWREWSIAALIALIGPIVTALVVVALIGGHH